MARITGRVQVLVDGNMLLNKAGAKASGIGLSGLPNFELKEVMGDGGIHGFTEEPIVAKLEVTVTDRDDISINDIAAVRENGTVIFRSADSGKAYTMNNATCVRNIEITAGEGETPLIFIGANWIESTY
jgi:hypothetical protein